jgi:16S rRNA (cytosine1402-N4)-methyltransferase
MSDPNASPGSSRDREPGERSEGSERSRGPGLHVPVLLDRVVALLAPALDHADAVLVDATLGLGGHSSAVLERCALARVVGIDRDPQALALAAERLASYGARFTSVHAVYDEIPAVLDDLGLASVDAVLFDLGVSSLQLDVVDRGFAYREDAPLDMRMDASHDPAGPTAADVLNTYPAADLARVLREYGEERFARQIANAVVKARETAPFTTSARLVDLLYDVIPAPARRTGGHPAKRTFQALRMEVNEELAVLRRALPAAIDALSVGGRVVVESYHSLEDRLVKRAFADATRSDVPEDLPFVPAGHEPAFRLLTRGAEKADATEIHRNPRAASVRLRALERLTPSPNRGVAQR